MTAQRHRVNPRRETAPPHELEWGKLLDTALTMPGSVGNTYNRFYQYSFLNNILFAQQGITEPVATYKRWQNLGRQVLKGSVAKTVVRPVVIEKKDEAGELESRKVLFKPVRAIFALSDTEGDELPPFEIPEWSQERALKELDITEVPFKMMDGDIQGYSFDRNVAINPVAVRPRKTLIHECAHIVLGHTTEPDMDDYQKHRGLYEFGAEGTAHLVLNELGVLDEASATESRGYLQHWMRDDRPPDSAIRRVFSSTEQILAAGRIAVEVEA